MTTQFPPGPSNFIPGRVLWQLRRNPLTYFTQLAQQYGDITYLRLAGRQLYLLNHPDYIQAMLTTYNKRLAKGYALQQAKRVLGNGLLTNEGASHLRQRRLIQPAFHRKRLAAYGQVMSEYTAMMLATWQAGAVMDVHSEMMRLTLSIVGKTLFDNDMGDGATPIQLALETFRQQFARLLTPLAPVLDKLPLLSTRRLQQAVAQMDEIVMALIEERRSEGDVGDIISMLVLAQEDGQGMGDQQIRDEVLTLLLAGHETTANALTWTWHLLGQHPQVLVRLQEELDGVLRGRLPSLSDMPLLPYTRMVFSEAMRLFPPAWAVGRQVLEACEFGGYVVPAGATVVASQWVMHRDERYFPEPNRFLPERWLRAVHPKFAYFPFGAGSRQCIGENFAWMEGVLILATIAQSWQLQLFTPQLVQPEPFITLRPKQGLRMIVEPRQQVEPQALTRLGEKAIVFS